MERRKSLITNKIAEYNQGYTLTDIKMLLLSMDPQAISQLLNQPFVDILNKDGAPFSDKLLNYPGVYCGTHINSDGAALSVRQAVRLANVLIRPDSIKRILKDHNQFVKGHTEEALPLIGQSWRTLLRSIDAWMEIDESEREDGEEDKECIQGDTARRAAEELHKEKYDKPIPWNSVYVGWGANPASRLAAHKRCTSMIFTNLVPSSPVTGLYINNAMNWLLYDLFGTKVNFSRRVIF
jgi:hypothetical protein